MIANPPNKLLGDTQMSCRILQRQSSFWDIVDGSGTVRIHFLQKEEFHFCRALVREYSIIDDHPLLLDYRSPWVNMYISGPAAQPAIVVDTIVDAWKPHLGDWRTPFNYLTATDPVRMLEEGFGQLISAPEPLSKVAVQVLADEGIPSSLLPGQPARWPRKALVADDNYVIATDFRVEAGAA